MRGKRERGEKEGKRKEKEKEDAFFFILRSQARDRLIYPCMCMALSVFQLCDFSVPREGGTGKEGGTREGKAGRGLCVIRRRRRKGLYISFMFFPSKRRLTRHTH